MTIVKRTGYKIQFCWGDHGLFYLCDRNGDDRGGAAVFCLSGPDESVGEKSAGDAGYIASAVWTGIDEPGFVAGVYGKELSVFADRL